MASAHVSTLVETAVFPHSTHGGLSSICCNSLLPVELNLIDCIAVAHNYKNSSLLIHLPLVLRLPSQVIISIVTLLDYCTRSTSFSGPPICTPFCH
jgi:hypothetical protein